MPGESWPWPQAAFAPQFWTQTPNRNVLKYDDIKQALRFAFRAGQRGPQSEDEDRAVNDIFASMFDGKEVT